MNEISLDLAMLIGIANPTIVEKLKKVESSISSTSHTISNMKILVDKSTKVIDSLRSKNEHPIS